MRRITLLALGVLLVLASTAGAKTPAYYIPKAHHACKASYRREVVKVPEHRHGRLVRRHHKIVMVKQVRCVYVAPKKTIKPTSTPLTYASKIDPSYTVSSTDPLTLTFSYSADATANGADLGAAGQLPAGILQMFSTYGDGDRKTLLCSMNVGGSVTGGTCGPETYAAPGTYALTTEYITSLTNSATDTETITINPWSTSTTNGISVADGGCPAPQPDGVGTSTYTCKYVVTAATSDQNANPLAQPITFTFSPTGFTPPPGENNDATFTMPGGQHSCEVILSETTATGSESTGGANASWSSAVAPGPPGDPLYCTGGGTISGHAVPSWTLVASFAGTPGFTASSSRPQTVTPPW